LCEFITAHFIAARDFFACVPTCRTVVLSSWRAALIGAMVAALATLPGLGIGTLWDNSETAYGEVAREVLLYRDAVVLHLNGHAWFVQPPLYFWVAAAFARVFGIGEFAFRLPSALATIATSAAVGYVVARLTTPRAAILATVVLSTSLMEVIVGRLAIMDAMLDLAVALAILAWFGAMRTGGRRWWYGGWVALALGTLAKGPVAVLIPVLVVGVWVVWERGAGASLRFPSAGRWILGLGVYCALVLPWALTLYAAAGPVALSEMVGHYTIGRYLGTIENQSGPLYYYVPVVILGTFPWFAFLVPATLDAFGEALRDREASLVRLCLVWAVLPFVFFSFAQTKLPNYIALELPALAILVAVWFERIAAREDRRSALIWTSVVPWTIGGLAFAIWAFSHDNKLLHDLHDVRFTLGAFGLAIFLGSALCFALLLARRSAWLAPFGLGATSLAAMLILVMLGEPLAERFKPIPPLALAIEQMRRPGDVVAIQGVSGSNALLFYTRPQIAILDGPNGNDAGTETDPRRAICNAPRAFVVTSRNRPAPDPTYGRARRIVASAGNDVVYLYDGPRCGVE
jgi:4-amino-4-deoxy-L-arabinose transferase-like glycosyltransferase